MTLRTSFRHDAGKAGLRDRGVLSSSTGQSWRIPMPYHSKPNGVNPTPIPGSYLARNHLSLIKRAFLAADLISGVKCLTAPTHTQAAALARVSCNYVHHAIRRQAERAEIERGHAPLILPRGEVVVPKTNGTTRTANGIDDAGLVQFVRSVGIDRVIHAAIAVERAQH